MKVQELFVGRRLLWILLFAVLALFLLTAATSYAAPVQGCGFNHHVRHGETLSSIGRHYGVSVSALMRANPRIKNPDRIYAGSYIYIPCSGPGGPGMGGKCSYIHYVKSGQTLTQIARYYHVHPFAIVRANNIHNPDLIYAGTGLCIP